MKKTFDGPTEGKGAVYAWEGNSKVGPAPFVSKVMQVFFSMDSMVGKDFESGLAGIKAIAEK